MRTYHWTDVEEYSQDSDTDEWVPAEVAQGLYDALDDALMWIDSPRPLKEAQDALAAADGEEV